MSKRPTMPKPLRLGSRQFWWIYNARDAENSQYKFVPTCHHKPPDVLRRLIAKGLMWAEKRQKFEWVGRTARWRGPLPAPEHWCGLTAKGERLLKDRKAVLDKQWAWDMERRAEQGEAQ